MEATVNTTKRPDHTKCPDPVSRYLKVCCFLRWMGREYPPTARLLLLVNTEDNLSAEELKNITGSSYTTVVENLARLVKEGLISYHESEAFRFNRNLYQINYKTLDERVAEFLTAQQAKFPPEEAYARPQIKQPFEELLEPEEL